jgi:hypothetical protein
VSLSLLIRFRPYATRTKIPLQCHNLFFSRMSAHSPIWFRLFDPKTGKQFEGTSTTSILQSSLVVPNVDQIREVVKTKHSNRLSSVDNAKISENEGKEEPLDPIESPGLLGIKDDMLIVVAPSGKPSLGVKEGGDTDIAF